MKLILVSSHQLIIIFLEFGWFLKLIYLMRLSHNIATFFDHEFLFKQFHHFKHISVLKPNFTHAASKIFFEIIRYHIFTYANSTECVTKALSHLSQLLFISFTHLQKALLFFKLCFVPSQRSLCNFLLHFFHAYFKGFPLSFELIPRYLRKMT